MATIKQLKTVPFTRVFRAIVSLLQHDPVLSNVIKPPNFRCWSGQSQDNMVFEFSNSPSLRITPHTSAEVWRFPNAFEGWLFLNVDMLIPGTDADDELNLWGAIEQAIYPDDRELQLANVLALQQAGASTGLAEFSQPAFDPTPSDRFFAATGQIKIAVLRQLTG
jgi:hypothetical protein